MKKSIRIALTAAAAAGIYTVGTFGVTKVLADIAMNREPLCLHKKNSSARLTGEKPDAACKAAKKSAAQRLGEAGGEIVTITSHDGLLLTGHWFPCPDAKRVILAFHGWRSSWNWDFGLMADFLRAEGCSVLYVEQRAQHGSEGAYIGFGLTERYDCVDWVQWAVDRCGALPIYLMGVSMGATTVLMAADLKLSGAVRGIIADSAYTSPRDIWRHVARANLHVPFLAGSVAADLFCRRRLKAGSGSCSTVTSLAGASVPVLLIHGEDDRFVPVQMAVRSRNACASPCRLLVVPKADHASAYFVDQAACEQAMRDFWAACGA